MMFMNWITLLLGAGLFLSPVMLNAGRATTAQPAAPAGGGLSEHGFPHSGKGRVGSPVLNVYSAHSEGGLSEYGPGVHLRHAG